MDPPPTITFSDHSLAQMGRRGLRRADILFVIGNPEQSSAVRPGRVVHQARMALGSSEKVYLVRVFVDADRDVLRIVTAYRTTRFSKYGSSPPS